MHDEAIEYERVSEAAEKFLLDAGLTPTQDAVGQMVKVFYPCLKIMCERPWEREGALWRKSGQLGVLGDLRKKFERVWYKYWLQRRAHPDSIFDMINYAGFVHRSVGDNWGEWGEPGSVDSD